MRTKAIRCHQRALALLAIGDDPSVRYAALELRYCIEYLLLDRLKSYMEYLDDSAMSKWTPKQIVKQLLEVDPNADQTVTLAVGIETTFNEPASDMHILGEDRRLKLKWANSNWNALGSFLHAPSLEQLQSGQSASPDVRKTRTEEIAEHLGHALASPISNLAGGAIYEFDCPECKKTTRRLVAGVAKDGGFVCKTPECQTIYDVQDGAAGPTFTMRMQDFRCGDCGNVAPFRANHVAPGNVLICDKCDTRWDVATRVVAVRLSPT